MADQDEIKIGARNNATDAQRLQMIHDMAVENGAQCESMSLGAEEYGKALADELVFFGGEVKALDGGKVGGYLVRFSTANDPDLTGDYFTSATDFGGAQKSAVYYQHGLDAKIGKRKLGEADHKIDSVGVWVEAQLNARDEYEKAIYEMAKAGKLGWSSGTAAHLVTRRTAGKASEITSWPLGLDASLTPTPAEPRNVAVSLKSLLTTEQAGQPAPDGASVESKTASKTESKTVLESIPSGETTMTPDEIKAAVQAELDARASQAKAEKETRDALKAELRKELQAERKGGYVYHKTAVKGDGDDSQMAAFKHWMRTGDEIAARRELEEDTGVDANGQPYKTALGETTGANGGYVVPVPYHNEIIAKRDEVAIPLRMGVKPLTTALASLAVPVENAKQSNFAIVAEAGSVDESEPTLDQVTITVYNWRRLLKVSTELFQDSTSNLDSYLASSIGRALGLTINAYCLTGTGTGQPKGGVNGGTLGTTAASATVFTAAEIIGHVYKMPAGYRDNMAWAMATATEGHIRGLTSNYLAFNPTPVGKGNPRGGNVAVGSDLLGYPVFNSASMAALATGNKTVLLANWEYYGFVERQQLVVERNPWLYMATGQIGIFASVRWGGNVLQAEAFQYAQMA